MNNCVGTGNLKFFLLFLIYTWTTCAIALGTFGWNYFFCLGSSCEFQGIELWLVRVVTLLGIGVWLFTTSMLMNVIYGIVTGIGTIDRLKFKTTNAWEECDKQSVPLTEIFGIGPYWTWVLPIDPLWHDHDEVLGYVTRQRLLRQYKEGSDVSSGV